MTEDWDSVTQMVNNLVEIIWIFYQKNNHWFIVTLATDDTFEVKQFQNQWVQLDNVQKYDSSQGTLASDWLRFKRPHISLVYCVNLRRNFPVSRYGQEMIDVFTVANFLVGVKLKTT